MNIRKLVRVISSVSLTLGVIGFVAGLIGIPLLIIDISKGEHVFRNIIFLFLIMPGFYLGFKDVLSIFGYRIKIEKIN